MYAHCTHSHIMRHLKAGLYSLRGLTWCTTVVPFHRNKLLKVSYGNLQDLDRVTRSLILPGKKAGDHSKCDG